MISKIKRLFSNVVDVDLHTEVNLNDFYLFEMDDQVIAIPYSSMNDTEKSLLELLTERQQQLTSQSVNNPWYRFLVLGEPIQIYREGALFMLHFEVRHSEDTNMRTWFEVFKEANHEIIEIIHLQGNQYLSIIELYEPNLIGDLINDLNAVVQSLDIDFETTTRGFVGQMTIDKNLLRHNFISEQALYQNNFEEKMKQNKIYRLSHVIIEGFTSYLEQNIDTLDILKQALLDHEAIELIEALYMSDGNITKSAEVLYIHRNTLIYRINKFKAATGFDLQNMQDLFVAYSFIKNKNR